jgi:hypothetical protein
METSTQTGFVLVAWLLPVSALLGKAGVLVLMAAAGLLITAGASFRRRGRAAQRGMRLLATVLGLAAVAMPAAAQLPFAAGPPGVALNNSQALYVSLPILNKVGAAVSNITVTSATLGKLPLLSPTLPYNLGSLSAGGTAEFPVSFNASSVPVGEIGPLVVSGTFFINATTISFSVQATVSKPKASTQTHLATAPPNQTTGSPFPATPPSWADVDEPNEGALPMPTIGPSHPVAAGSETNIGNLVNGDAQMELVHPLGLTSPLEFYVNTNFGNTISTSGWPLDPNVASKGDTVLVTHNTYLEYSTDGGHTFIELDPTTIFPNNSNNKLIDGGLCCDQNVVYVPSIDRFVWVMQFWPGTSTSQNRDRVAAAKPADLLAAGCTPTGCSFNLATFANAWTYWDLTSDTFSMGAHNMDYPDLSYGANNLYVSTDISGQAALISRIPLSEIAASVTINFQYWEQPAYPARVTRNTDKEAYWAIQNTTSQMEVYSWTEGSNLIYSRPVNVPSWYLPSTNPFVSITPDGQNWLNFTQGHVPSVQPVGATIAGNDLWFAWNAPAAPEIPYPHIRIAQINFNSFSPAGSQAIWNQGYAYAYGFLNTNSNGEVGMSYAWGGSTQYVNAGVAFLTGTQEFWASQIGNIGTTRYGDFLGIRVDPDNPKCFVTAGMAVDSVSGTNANYGDLVFSEYGRQGDCKITVGN